jgi:hypothetical protein
MPLIGAAAPSPHVQCRQRNVQPSVAVTQIDGVTDIQFGRCVQLSVAAGRRIGADSAVSHPSVILACHGWRAAERPESATAVIESQDLSAST